MRHVFRYDKKLGRVVEVGVDDQPEGGPQTMRAWEKEKHCEALAINPKNLKWQKIEDEEVGIRDQAYDSNGCPVFTSKRAYEDYIVRHGYHHRGRVRNKKLSYEIDGTLLKRIMERFQCS